MNNIHGQIAIKRFDSMPRLLGGDHYIDEMYRSTIMQTTYSMLPLVLITDGIRTSVKLSFTEFSNKTIK